jgi:hypothetical protein
MAGETMKHFVPIVLTFCLFVLPSCGDDLCSRASDKFNECSEYPMLEDALCWAIRQCHDCKTEIRAYSKCIVEISSCAEWDGACAAELQEWYSCMDANEC